MIVYGKSFLNSMGIYWTAVGIMLVLDRLLALGSGEPELPNRCWATGHPGYAAAPQ